MVYKIEDIRKMVAAIQLLFVGKVRRKKGNFIPKQLMTVWVNNMKKRGRPITTNKTSIIKFLQQLYPPNVYCTDVFGTQIAKKRHLRGYIWLFGILALRSMDMRK